MKFLAVGLVVGLLAGAGGTRVAPKLLEEENQSPDRQAPTRTATGQVWLTDRLATFDATFRITKEEEGEQYDQTPLVCHGGRAHITWYVGNLEPTVPDTGIHLSLLFDGRKVGTLLKGSTRGIWNDGPAEIQTVVPCPAGRHEVAVTLDSVEGGWGIPYAGEADRVQRGFIIQEVAP